MGLIPKWSREAARIGLELSALQVDLLLTAATPDGATPMPDIRARLEQLKREIAELPVN